MVLSTYTELYNHHHRLIPQHSHHPAPRSFRSLWLGGVGTLSGQAASFLGLQFFGIFSRLLYLSSPRVEMWTVCPFAQILTHSAVSWECLLKMLKCKWGFSLGPAFLNWMKRARVAWPLALRLYSVQTVSGLHGDKVSRSLQWWWETWWWWLSLRRRWVLKGQLRRTGEENLGRLAFFSLVVFKLSWRRITWMACSNTDCWAPPPEFLLP